VSENCAEYRNQEMGSDRLIEIKISKDEAGVRIAYFYESEDGEPYSDYITADEFLDVWEKTDELACLTHDIVFDVMNNILRRSFHEMLTNQGETKG